MKAQKSHKNCETLCLLYKNIKAPQRFSFKLLDKSNNHKKIRN